VNKIPRVNDAKMKTGLFILWLLGFASLFASFFGIIQGVHPSISISLPFMYFLGVITGYLVREIK